MAPLLRAVGEVQLQRLLPPVPLHTLLLPLAGIEAGTNYSRNDSRLPEFPSAMIPGNRETHTLVCAMQVRSAQK